MPLWSRIRRQKTQWIMSPQGFGKWHKVDPGNPERTACGFRIGSDWKGPTTENPPHWNSPTMASNCKLPECQEDE